MACEKYLEIEEALESAIYNLDNNVPKLGMAILPMATEQVKLALKLLQEEA